MKPTNIGEPVRDLDREAIDASQPIPRLTPLPDRVVVFSNPASERMRAMYDLSHEHCTVPIITIIDDPESET